VKNIAIALNAGYPEQRNAITKFFSEQKWAYWHWVDDFWIVQVPDFYTPKSLHDKLESVANLSASTMLVFHFQGNISFWGRGAKEAWDWLRHIGHTE
jgi:hypothetical protein